MLSRDRVNAAAARWRQLQVTLTRELRLFPSIDDPIGEILVDGFVFPLPFSLRRQSLALLRDDRQLFLK